MKHEELSDADFEKIEANLDAMEYKSARAGSSGPRRPPGTYSAWKRQRARNTRIGAVVGLVIAAVVVALIVSSGSSAQRPSCNPHSVGCSETSDGYWVPIWYFSALTFAQGTATGRLPSSTGAQPSAAQLSEAGASAQQAAEAESYAGSVADDDSSDSSGDSSDDSDSSSDDDDSGGGDQ